MAVAPLSLLIAAKFGRSTSVNTQLIKRFGNSLKEILSKPEFDKTLLKDAIKFKSVIYKANIEKMLTETLGKENTTKESVDYIMKQIANMEKIPAEMYETLIKLLSPFTPHLAEEMWARLGYDTLVITEIWPAGDAKLAEDNMVTMGVQLNGKMRGTVTVAKDAAREDVEKAALALDNVARQLEGQTVKKIIVVPNRIVNIVI